MCGIIGYVGISPCLELIMQGLKKLEYRGYDSAGIAVMDRSGIEIVKAEGKLGNLKPLIGQLPQNATLAMGHTRWATHGKPSANNAHPHGRENVAIIHNGIVENYKELKIELLEEQRIFHSETDSEVIVHLLQKELEVESDFMVALRQVLSRLQGAYALGIFCLADPEAIYLVKHGSPLVVCKSGDATLFASDAFALMEHGQDFIFLDDGEIARVTKDSATFWSAEGEVIEKEPTFLRKVEIDAQMGQFRHYMIKEIHDQSAVVSSTINRLVDAEGRIDQGAIGLSGIDFNRIQRIHVVGCGSAYHAGWCARYFLEPMIKMPVDIELASEFRYRQPHIDKSTLVIAVTQSGETADTLASVKFAKTKGCQILSICNVEHSSIPRQSDGVLYMHAGPEIGVASTKAYVSMMLNIYLLGAAIAQSRGQSIGLELTNLDSSLRLLPTLVQKVVALEKDINEFAKSFFKENHCLFIGRGINYIIACEGALKLKEISYIHAEAYAGGELKHGPIALIDKSMPVIAVAPLDEHHGKMLSNVEEICARGGRVVGIGSADDLRFRSMCEHYIPCPQIEHPFLQAIISVIPLQLLAYHVAVHRGTDVDQPRNLAKSVTVE